MSESGWSIRLFETNDYADEATVDSFSNFKRTKARMLDSVIAFSGMYGIDNYLIWNIHKDLPHYDFSTLALDLNIFMYKSTGIISFQDFYRVQDIRYNTVKKQYTVYALSETTVRLRAKLVGYNVKSLSYLENRTAREVIEEVIAKNNIFRVIFHEDNDATKNMLHYEYRYFDIDPEWTVLDFIEYIADDNKYEWCIDTFVDKETNKPYYILHIGHELKADLNMNASKPLSIEIDNQSESLYTMKITTNTSPMQPLASWEKTHKCVWSKHTAGKGGGISKGCFVPTGMGHFDKHLFVRTLEGEIERSIGSSILNRRKVRIPSINIGNILKDEGIVDGKTLPYIDEVSIQKNPKTYTITEPHNIIINRGDDLAVQHQLERATRSTPYLDHNAGLFFPSPKLDNSPPNSIIFNVNGKRESAVIGPYVLGDGRVDENGNRTLIIPIKNRDDFRFRLPNGGEIYYKSSIGEQETGSWIFQAPLGFTFKTDVITDPGDIPSELRIGGEENSSTITFHDNYFTIEGPISLLTLREDGDFLITPSYDSTGQNAPRYAFYLRNISGEIILHADDNIDIEIRSEGVLSSGTINIDTLTGTINIGANANAVNIAGGANTLAHKNHNHIAAPAMDGVFKVPLMGSVAANTTGTTKTKAD